MNKKMWIIPHLYNEKGPTTKLKIRSRKYHWQQKQMTIVVYQI